ncbi:MAG TPA: endopeptidase La [Myxococcales bacterium]|nr:endopeptidase La [Myxococcales bacterium]HIL02174.1 endopeptidase La [Myxococcales bacterium]
MSKPQEPVPNSLEVLDPAGESLQVPSVLPLLPVRDIIIFPGVTVPLTVGRLKSIAALERTGTNGFMLVVTQRNASTEEPSVDDLFEVGTLVKVLRIVDARHEGKQALVVGIARVELGEIVSQSPELSAQFTPMESVLDDIDIQAIWQRVIGLAKRVVDLRDDYPDEWKAFIVGIPGPGMLADLLASNLTLPPEEGIELLREPRDSERLKSVEQYLEREVTIAETQKTLRDQADAGGLDKKRRERMLRSRMREIQEEIGESDAGMREVDELHEKLEAAELPEDAYEQAERELKRLSALPQHAPDRHLIRTYLEWITDLPWSIETEDNLDLHHAREILDADHHGLDQIKDRILEFLAVRKLAPDSHAPILCFVGPPGVGKTSLGRSIARSMGRKFARASLGGVRDEAEIRGHRRTYVGAMPGRIIQSLKRAGSRNPIFLLDEIDKLGSDFRGDPSSALLEVLDPEQNHQFSDHYIECAFDLSGVLFIATANTLSTIPPALLDRMEVIELSGYTEAEKIEIGRTHLIPRQLEAHGLTSEHIELDDAALQKVVAQYTREAGVRNLERFVASLMRKSARRIATDGPETRVHIDTAFVSESLGAPPHLPEMAERTRIPGVAVGLAVTSHGGDILFIEAASMPGGKGVRLRLTGQLGDVMRESAEAALSWVRSHAGELGLDPEAFSSGEIHLHVPAGAVPKDGPSAGIALVTAIVSALSNRRARSMVAMTGEISLRGRVLPVGGIKGKLFAASRAGIETVVMPRRNEKDLREVPEEVQDSLEIHLVDTIEEALAVTFETGEVPIAH